MRAISEATVQAKYAIVLDELHKATVCKKQLQNKNSRLTTELKSKDAIECDLEKEKLETARLTTQLQQQELCTNMLRKDLEMIKTDKINLQTCLKEETQRLEKTIEHFKSVSFDCEIQFKEEKSKRRQLETELLNCANVQGQNKHLTLQVQRLSKDLEDQKRQTNNGLKQMQELQLQVDKKEKDHAFTKTELSAMQTRYVQCNRTLKRCIPYKKQFMLSEVECSRQNDIINKQKNEIHKVKEQLALSNVETNKLQEENAKLASTCENHEVSIESMKRQFTTQTAELKQSQTEEQKQRSIVCSLQIKLNTCSGVKNDLEKEMSHRSKKGFAKDIMIMNLETSTAKSKQKHKELKSNIKDLTILKESYQNKYQDAQDELGLQSKRIHEMQDDSLQESLRKDEKIASLKRYRWNYFSAKTQMIAMKQQLDTLQMTLSNYQNSALNDRARETERIATFKAEREALEKELTDIKHMMMQQNLKVHESESAKDTHEQAVKVLEGEINILREENKDLKHMCDQKGIKMLRLSAELSRDKYENTALCLLTPNTNKTKVNEKHAERINEEMEKDTVIEDLKPKPEQRSSEDAAVKLAQSCWEKRTLKKEIVAIKASKQMYEEKYEKEKEDNVKLKVALSSQTFAAKVLPPISKKSKDKSKDQDDSGLTDGELLASPSKHPKCQLDSNHMPGFCPKPPAPSEDKSKYKRISKRFPGIVLPSKFEVVGKKTPQPPSEDKSKYKRISKCFPGIVLPPIFEAVGKKIPQPPSEVKDDKDSEHAPSYSRFPVLACKTSNRPHHPPPPPTPRPSSPLHLTGIKEKLLPKR